MSDNRNIIDFYKYWTDDAIKADLDTRRSNFSVVCCNFAHDFNIATVIRNANAFVAREVIILGRRRYDRRGTVGTHNYTRFKYVRETDMLTLKDDDFVVGVDNVEDAEDIIKFEWPTKRHVIMVFGQEQIGIPEKVKARCHKMIYIPQYGSVRSLNVGCASAIAMHDYMAKVR